MIRICKAVLFFVVILTVAFSTDVTSAGKQKPVDPLSRTLQDAALKQLDAEVVRQLGQATSFPPTTIDNFQPKKLEVTPEIMNQRLEPGDYSIDVIGYCTKWSLH